MFVNIQSKQGHFPQISINATVEAFKFTKIQRWEHKITKPTATEYKQRSSAKPWAQMALSHAHMFVTPGRRKEWAHSFLRPGHTLHVSVVTVPVHWPWHAPAQIKRGGHFGVLTGMWVVQPITCTGHPTSESHRSKLGLRSTNAMSQYRLSARHNAHLLPENN